MSRTLHFEIRRGKFGLFQLYIYSYACVRIHKDKYTYTQKFIRYVYDWHVIRKHKFELQILYIINLL